MRPNIVEVCRVRTVEGEKRLGGGVGNEGNRRGRGCCVGARAWEYMVWPMRGADAQRAPCNCRKR